MEENRTDTWQDWEGAQVYLWPLLQSLATSRAYPSLHALTASNLV